MFHNLSVLAMLAVWLLTLLSVLALLSVLSVLSVLAVWLVVFDTYLLDDGYTGVYWFTFVLVVMWTDTIALSDIKTHFLSLLGLESVW